MIVKERSISISLSQSNGAINSDEDRFPRNFLDINLKISKTIRFLWNYNEVALLYFVKISRNKYSYIIT